jgi:hypothetical protein
VATPTGDSGSATPLATMVSVTRVPSTTHKPRAAGNACGRLRLAREARRYAQQPVAGRVVGPERRRPAAGTARRCQRTG